MSYSKRRDIPNDTTSIRFAYTIRYFQLSLHFKHTCSLQ